MKFLIAMALTLMMGVTFTSCLDSEDNGVRSGVAIARVSSSLGLTFFQTADGHTITPSPESVSALEANGVNMGNLIGEIVYVMYTWDSTQLTVEEGTDIAGVDLYALASMDSPVEIVSEKGAPNDSTANMPVIDLGVTSTSTPNNEAQAQFFDANTLLLPINYYINNYLHYFTLVYYPNDDVNADMPTLYLRHKNWNDKSVTPGSPTAQVQGLYGGVLNAYVRAFDLTAVLNRYRLDHGMGANTPLPVRIVFSTATNTTTLDENTPTKSYTYTYQESSTN